ncbi:MAG: hypothetical protein LBP59_04485 [Planctomycetaceae bacterium]|nr:hypothetical protein [Planctomycetaceae bacterium]
MKFKYERRYSFLKMVVFKIPFVMIITIIYVAIGTISVISTITLEKNNTENLETPKK